MGLKTATGLSFWNNPGAAASFCRVFNLVFPAAGRAVLGRAVEEAGFAGRSLQRRTAERLRRVAPV